MAKEKFYITTAIDYVNAEPHIGHAYQKIVADALARWHKYKGKSVFFLTGTDEHGKKVAEAAEAANKDTKEFVDENTNKFKEAWNLLNIQPDRFIRTTDSDHKKLVQDIIKKTDKAGDIYKGNYSGLYCVGCEAYYTERDAPDSNCPLHERPLEKIEEESYFFKLSKYEKFLLDLYEKNPEFILPEERRNEIKSRVKEGLKDLSVSRTSFDWGIPFPLDKKHIVYVWYDALLNYYTATRKKGKEDFWPASVHILGKDNSWFHTVYWPAMLKSVELPLPKTVFVHGFLTFNGKKISKSLGNSISPKTLVEKYGSDSIRYFTLRQFPFASGDDGDFSEQSLIQRHNDELANKLGNLVSRVSGLIEKHGVSKCPNALIKKLKEKEINSLVDNYKIDRALSLIFKFIDNCNEYVQEKKPWETKDSKVLYELKESILKISELLWAFIPESSEKITLQFSAKKIKKSEILFQKVSEIEEPKKEEIKELIISKEASKLGITAHSALITNTKVSNKSRALESLKKEAVKKYSGLTEKQKKVFEGYSEIYKALGFPEAHSGTVNLFKILDKSGKIPNINTVVDSYNLTSIKTAFTIGAHDADKISPPVSIKITEGNEKYTKLNTNKSETLKSGEYACVDSEKVLCYMELKQSDLTKITKDTKNVFLYIQGNKNTPESEITSALKEICERITKISGGEYKLLKTKIKLNQLIPNNLAKILLGSS